jgi:hypothetical protein
MPLLQITLVAASIVIPETATTLNENRANRVISVKKTHQILSKKNSKSTMLKKYTTSGDYYTVQFYSFNIFIRPIIPGCQIQLAKNI